MWTKVAEASDFSEGQGKAIEAQAVQGIHDIVSAFGRAA